MYRAFDRFLKIDTWHKLHPADEKRFFVALSSVVGDDAFSPDEMGAYMRQKGKRRDKNREHPFDKAIERYAAAAQVVKDYLSATGA